MSLKDLFPENYTVDEANPIRTTSPDIDGIQYIVMTHAGFMQQATEVAEQIRNSDLKDMLSCMVAIERGGLPVALALNEIGGFNLPVHAIKASSYHGVAARKQKVEIDTSRLPVGNQGNILLVDELVDQGYTLAAAVNKLEDNGHASYVATAVLNQRDYSLVKPDFSGGTVNHWIVHPWEIHDWVGYYRGEFFSERFPGWMFKFDGAVGEIRLRNYAQCYKHALEIGFKEEELPDLGDQRFLYKLVENLRQHLKEQVIKGVDINPDTFMRHLLPRGVSF